MHMVDMFDRSKKLYEVIGANNINTNGDEQ